MNDLGILIDLTHASRGNPRHRKYDIVAVRLKRPLGPRFYINISLYDLLSGGR